MSRFFAIDIRNKIINLLNNGGVDSQGNVRKSLKNQLIEIDLERSSTTPGPRKITYKWADNQFPIVLVATGKSELLQDELLTDDLNLTPEIFTIGLSAMIKSNSNDIHNYVENYVQAICEILNGYEDENITYILADETDKGDLYINKQQFTKSGMVIVKVRIN
jgi:hypothetical protein